MQMKKFQRKKSKVPPYFSGHLDTQLFPGFDRDIVKKTVQRRKKFNSRRRKEAMYNHKEAGRTKNLGELGDLVGEQTFQKDIWTQAYAAAKDYYNKIKQTAPDKALVDTIIDEIKGVLMGMGSIQVDEHTAELAASTVFDQDARWRKAQGVRKQASVAKKVVADGGLDNNTEIHTDPLEYDEADNEDGNGGIENVEVIYPDVGHPGDAILRFTVPVFGGETMEDKELVDQAWEMLNTQDVSQWAGKRTRSSMVGDVYTVRGQHYLILGMGFAQITDEELQKWLTIPTRDKLMAFDEQRLQAMLHQAFANGVLRKESCEDCSLTVEAKKKKKKNNPWAICTKSVGRDSPKYERCVMDVKKQQGTAANEQSVKTAGEKWIQDAVPPSHEGKFGTWCKSHGFDGVCQGCIDKAIAAGGHAARMANFAINVPNSPYSHPVKKASVTTPPVVAQSIVTAKQTPKVTAKQTVQPVVKQAFQDVMELTPRDKVNRLDRQQLERLLESAQITVFAGESENQLRDAVMLYVEDGRIPLRVIDDLAGS